MAAPVKDARSVFVRGVSFSAREKDLEALFSDIGPVRTCFLVKDKGKEAHKGYGIVQFALVEDAQRAVTELNQTAHWGRKLQVEAALKRAPFEQRKRKRADDTAPDTEPPAAAAAPVKKPAKKARPPQPALSPEEQAAAKAAVVGEGRQVTRAASKQASLAKQRMVRTVALGGLPPDSLAMALSLAQQAGKVEEVISPVSEDAIIRYKLRQDGCSGEVVFVVYDSAKAALKAVSELHGRPLTDLPAQAHAPEEAGGQAGKKRKLGHAQLDGSTFPSDAKLWARQVSGEGLHLKKWRLIIRNLAFNAQETALRAVLSPTGFVWELTIPRNPDGSAKGYAFAGFLCRPHAERAIALVNGQPLRRSQRTLCKSVLGPAEGGITLGTRYNQTVAGRRVAVDWALSKKAFQDAVSHAAAAGGDAAIPAPDDAAKPDAAAGEPHQVAAEQQQRQAVGSGRDTEQEAGEVDPEQERAMVRNVLDSVLADHGDAAAGPASKQQPHPAAKRKPSGQADRAMGPREGDTRGRREPDVRALAGSEAAAAAGDGRARVPSRPPMPAPAQQQQQQQQPVPEHTAPDALPTTAAAAAGGAKGKPAASAAEASAAATATVFVRGLPLDATKQQLAARLASFGPVKACRLVVDKASGKLKGTAFVEFRAASAARDAATACGNHRQGQGPGVLVAGKPVELDLALSKDAARGLAAARAGGAGPTDNRSLYLAKEGQIEEGSPAWEGMSAADRARRKRAAEEKNLKLRSPNFLVSRTRLAIRNLPPSCDEKALKQLVIDAVRERASKERPVVKQVKLLRDPDKAGPDGEARSRGRGFVELTDHSHAMAALRQLNNNPAVFGKERRPIVEFALENVKTLQLRSRRLARQQQQQQQEPPSAQQDGDAAAPQSVPNRLRKPRYDRGRRELRGQAAALTNDNLSGKAAKGRAASAGRPSKGPPGQRGSSGKLERGVDTAPAAAPARPVVPNGTSAGQGKRKNKSWKEKRAAAAAGKPSAAAVGHPPAGKSRAPAGEPKLPGAAQPLQNGGRRHAAADSLPQRQPRGTAAGRRALTSDAAAMAGDRRQRGTKRKGVRSVGGPPGDASQSGGPKTKRRKGDQRDALDALVKAYRSKLFDGPPAKKGGDGSVAAPRQSGGLKRWFE